MPPTDTPEDLSGPSAYPCRPPVHGRRPRAPTQVSLQLPADTIAPSMARHQLRRWLAAAQWPAEDVDDIVMAASEAVSNSAEHAYAGRPAGFVDLQATIETLSDGRRRIICVVTDYGRWRPVPVEHENRRRGLPLMRAVMETVTIDPRSDGGDQARYTRVVLTSRPIPPAGDR